MRRRCFLHAQEGAISVVTALCSVAAIGFAGLATDVGAVYLQTRRLQGATDLSALAAAQNPVQARLLATRTAEANGWGGARVSVATGTYRPDPSIPVAQRFAAAGASANAVRVEISSPTPLYFGRLFVPSGQMTITRRATAAQTRLASFQIGSRLLSLHGGVANQVLGGLTGSSVNLSVMDYNALLGADIDLLTYVDALRTRLDLEAATFDETLSHEIEAPEALEAIADLLTDRVAENAMRSLAAASRSAEPIGDMRRLVDLGPYASQDEAALSQATQVNVSAMDLATAILQIAGGDRQVRLQLGATIPGLASTEAWLAIGERPNNSPWLSVTDDYDVIVRTAQMRLFVQANVRPLGALSSVAAVRIPILVEAASAQARLRDVSCGFDPSDRSVTLSVAPSVGSLSLGDINVHQLDNFRTPLRPSRAELVRVAPIRIEGQARVDIGGEEWRDVRFSGADIDERVVKTVATRDIAGATVGSLLGNADLRVQVGGLGIGLQPITSSLRNTLAAAAAPLDALVNGLTDLLGVHLGEADVRVNGVRCGGAALVG